MTFCVENETEQNLPFDIEQAAKDVILEALNFENCPYEAQVNVLLTDMEGIHAFNKQFRDIDSPTDVLSFPNICYEKPADFSKVEESFADYFEPESGELMLGDIILCVDKIYAQAKEYEHSVMREFSFLIAHSMLHLFGYDHILSEEAETMGEKQNMILKNLGIERN